jgi:hypothetical protein
VTDGVAIGGVTGVFALKGREAVLRSSGVEILMHAQVAPLSY